MFKLILAVISFSSFIAFAEELSHSRQLRENSQYYAMLDYSWLDLVLPSKWGITAGWARDADKIWEAEYLKSSVSVPFVVEDIGEMTDERFSVIQRNFLGTETFNFSYGVSYHKFKVNIGNKYLSSVSSSAPDVDLLRVETLGFTVGIGNRWIFSNRWMVGIDWASLAQPVFITRKNNKFEDFSNDSSAKDTVDTAVKLIAWLPRISLLKLQVGYSF